MIEGDIRCYGLGCEHYFQQDLLDHKSKKPRIFSFHTDAGDVFRVGIDRGSISNGITEVRADIVRNPESQEPKYVNLETCVWSSDTQGDRFGTVHTIFWPWEDNLEALEKSWSSRLHDAFSGANTELERMLGNEISMPSPAPVLG